VNGSPDFDPTRSDAIRELLGDTVMKDSRRRQTTNRVTALISLILAALLLSGGGVAWAVTGRLPFTPVPTTPTPAATPSIDLSDPSSWIIGDGSVGPLKLDGSISAAAASMTAFAQANSQGCTVTKYDLGSQPPPPLTVPKGVSIWLAPNAQASDQIGIILVWYSGNYDSTLVATSPKTAQGIGIGSAFAQLQAAYPGMTETTSGGSPVYSVQRGGSWINFQLSDPGGPVMYIWVMNSPYAPTEVCG
jgi:hypothetical protein